MPNSPSALLWQYPLSSPSTRFTRFNNLVRSLDQRFNALDTHRKSNWARFSSIWPSSVFCLPGIFQDEPPPEFRRWAIACYQNVNCCRIDQGQAVSDSVPLQVTPRQNDTITPQGSDPYAVTWGGRSSSPSGDFVCSVYTRPLNHPAESGPTITSMRFSFLAPITYGGSFSIGEVYDVNPGLAAVPFVAMAYVVQDLGGFPIFGGRQGFYRDGSPG